MRGIQPSPTVTQRSRTWVAAVPGNREAVWPSSPSPSRIRSNCGGVLPQMAPGAVEARHITGHIGPICERGESKRAGQAFGIKLPRTMRALLSGSSAGTYRSSPINNQRGPRPNAPGPAADRWLLVSSHRKGQFEPVCSAKVRSMTWAIVSAARLARLLRSASWISSYWLAAATGVEGAFAINLLVGVRAEAIHGLHQILGQPLSSC